MVLLAETTGTWYAVSSVTEEPVTDEQINKGVIGEGLGCLVAALVGTTPVTGYSTNAGLFRLQGLLVKSLCDGVRLVYPIVPSWENFQP